MFVRIEKESENITKTLQNYFFFLSDILLDLENIHKKRPANELHFFDKQPANTLLFLKTSILVFGKKDQTFFDELSRRWQLKG